MGFPRTVNVQQAPAVAGDFASRNPRSSVVAGQGALVSGANGLTIGNFAWNDGTGVCNNFGNTVPTGFLGRQLQGTFTTYLAGSGMGVLPAQPITLYSVADVWVKNLGTTAVTIGMKAYADYSTGAISFAATGTPPSSGTASAATLYKCVSYSTGGALPTTNTCTASISDTTLTVTAVGSGSVLGAGQTLSGGSTSVGFVETNTTIVKQITGTAGNTGTYQVSISQTVGSCAITMSGGGLTLTGTNTSGIFAPGMVIGGVNIPTGTTILGYGTATAGGAGTYYVDRPAAVAATASTITASNAMILTIAGSVSGTFALDDLIYGTTVTAAHIAANGVTNANLTGLGGAGTYLTDTYQSSELTAQTISVYTGVETKWFAASAGQAGDMIVMSSNVLG